MYVCMYQLIEYCELGGSVFVYSSSVRKMAMGLHIFAQFD